MQHGQVVEDAVLDLLQVVVVLVEDLGRAPHVHLGGRGNAPRQAGHPLEVGARDAVLRRHGGDARQALQLLQRLGLDLFGHAGRFDLLAQVLDIALRLVALAQFLLDGLELLAQVELALALRKLALDLRLDLAAQFEQFGLAGQVAMHLAGARFHVQLLENRLALGMAEVGQGAGDEVGQFAEFGDGAGHGGKVVGKIGAGADNLLELRDHVLPKRLDLRRHRGLDLRDALDSRAQERLRGGEFAPCASAIRPRRTAAGFPWARGWPCAAWPPCRPR